MATSTLRWAVSRSAVPGAIVRTQRNGETKNKERSIDIKKILKVETGTAQFPGSQGTKGEQFSGHTRDLSLPQRFVSTAEDAASFDA